MAKSFPINVLEFYGSIFRKHPLAATSVFVLVLAIYVATIATFLDFKLSSLLARFRRPQLEIVLNPGETYNVGEATLTLKRIELASHAQALTGVRISIRTSEAVEALRISTVPDVPCSPWRRVPTGGKVIFEISCESFAKNQRADISLVTTKKLDETATFLVEAVGSYAPGRLVGASASGLLVR